MNGPQFRVVRLQCSAADLDQHLSAREHLLLSTIVDPVQRQLKAALFAALKDLAGVPGQDFSVETSPSGRPMIAGVDRALSTSDKATVGAVAIAANKTSAVGIDVEDLVTPLSSDSFHDHAFTRIEREQTLSFLARMFSFTACESMITLWSIKEACVKALNYPLIATHVTIVPSTTGSVVQLDPQCPAYTRAVAPGATVAVTVRRIDPHHVISLASIDCHAASTRT